MPLCEKVVMQAKILGFENTEKAVIYVHWNFKKERNKFVSRFLL